MHLCAVAPWLQQESGPSSYLDHGICAHLSRRQNSFHQSQHDQSGCGSSRRHPSGFVDVEMLEASATDYHISSHCEIDQPHAVGRSCRVEAELSDSWTEETFLPNLRVEISKDNLDVVGRAFVELVL